MARPAVIHSLAGSLRVRWSTAAAERPTTQWPADVLWLLAAAAWLVTVVAYVRNVLDR